MWKKDMRSFQENVLFIRSISGNKRVSGVPSSALHNPPRLNTLPAISSPGVTFSAAQAEQNNSYACIFSSNARPVATARYKLLRKYGLISQLNYVAATKDIPAHATVHYAKLHGSISAFKCAYGLRTQGGLSLLYILFKQINGLRDCLLQHRRKHNHIIRNLDD